MTSLIAVSTVYAYRPKTLTDGYILEAADSLEYPALKPEQEEAISQLLMGIKGCVRCSDTGFGKLLSPAHI